ncbi:hypothetical protein MNBD_GAMMA16-1774 [hydrothermal vent metagenome]|uniref:DUF4398 domain-containing protein n=1 Tax=hydrothermal vent metagenome TaxID=652676 RepID=A0A3B0ZRA8_9ZZZZ
MCLQSYPLVFFFLLLVGCASYPTQELSNARQALKAAQDADAAHHAPIHLNKATELLSNAEHALEPKDLSYARARNNALASKTEAIKARKLSLAFALTIKELNDRPLSIPVHNEASQLLEQAKDAAQSGDDILASSLISQARTVIQTNIKEP